MGDIINMNDLQQSANEVITIMHGEYSTVMMNSELGGWTKTKDGGYVSLEYANSLNRAERRGEGITIEQSAILTCEWELTAQTGEDDE